MLCEFLDVLYAFESNEFVIAEVKRKDVDPSSKPDQRFFWFQYDKLHDSLSRLDFVSMESKADCELRVFKQGRGVFTKEAMMFNTDVLRVVASKELSAAFKEAVLSYFG